jgi:hypothetical protein
MLAVLTYLPHGCPSPVPPQSQDAVLPMMYMADCLEGTWQLMMAPRERLTRTTYNVQSMSFSPAQLAAAIQVRGWAVHRQLLTNALCCRCTAGSCKPVSLAHMRVSQGSAAACCLYS